jgi:hypothetical protein
MKRILITAFLVFGSLIAVLLPANAGDAPVWHLGSFSKSSTVEFCLISAKAAMGVQGLAILNGDNHTILGGNDDVIVQVSCSSNSDGSTWVVVTAFSNNSSTAEGARNSIRQYIVDSRIRFHGIQGNH